MDELLKQFPSLYRSQMDNFAKHFLDVVTTYNDEICYVKHVLAPCCVFHPIWVLGGGSAPKGVGTQPANAALQPQQLKNGNFMKLIFFRHLNHPNWSNRLCKACFTRYLSVFHTIWARVCVGGGGGAPTGLRAQLSSLSISKMEISEIDFFDTLTIQNDHIFKYSGKPEDFFGGGCNRRLHRGSPPPFFQ